MEVDFSKLTRDYRINPLKRGETIPKEDLQYLFIDANLTLKQMAKIINRHPNQIGRQCKENHVIKGKEQQKISLKKEFRSAEVIPTITNINGIYIFNTAFPLATAKENIKGAIRDAIKLIMNQIIICFFCIIFIFLIGCFYYFRYCHIQYWTITAYRNNYIGNI